VQRQQGKCTAYVRSKRFLKSVTPTNVALIRSMFPAGGGRPRCSGRRQYCRSAHWCRNSIGLACSLVRWMRSCDAVSAPFSAPGVTTLSAAAGLLQAEEPAVVVVVAVVDITVDAAAAAHSAHTSMLQISHRAAVPTVAW
jgi:hypothetical protein